jgi:hypothetical protein|uniref:Uncharacterized protein n=1 Tax=viral metagenome TaxID=1070528 RepID=A0A6C0JTG1_9ZZZZ
MFSYIYYKCLNLCFTNENKDLCENLLDKKATLTIEEYIEKKKYLDNSMHYYSKLEEHV